MAKRLEFHHTPKHSSWMNPVLSLPQGWRRSSSACWPGPACGYATATRTAWKRPSTPASQNAIARKHHRLALHRQGRPTFTHRLYL